MNVVVKAEAHVVTTQLHTVWWIWTKGSIWEDWLQRGECLNSVESSSFPQSRICSTWGVSGFFSIIRLIVVHFVSHRCYNSLMWASLFGIVIKFQVRHVCASVPRGSVEQQECLAESSPLTWNVLSSPVNSSMCCHVCNQPQLWYRNTSDCSIIVT